MLKYNWGGKDVGIMKFKSHSTYYQSREYNISKIKKDVNTHFHVREIGEK